MNLLKKTLNVLAFVALLIFDFIAGLALWISITSLSLLVVLVSSKKGLIDFYKGMTNEKKI